MSSLQITREDGAEAGRYVAQVEGQEAELTYLKTGEGVLVADHTGVPPALEGRGIGSALVKALVEDARAEGRKILPACPFVAAQFKRHPDWSDLLA